MITINEDFKSLIPPLTPEEYIQLEKNILADGCRDALVTWQNWIVDGHNRFEICNKHNIPYKTIIKNFDNDSDAKVWIIDNQDGRRNLPDFAKFELKQKKAEILKEIGRAKQKQTLKIGDSPVLSTTDRTEHNTQKQIAVELGWGVGKVARAEVVSKRAPEEVKEKIRAGEVTINTAYQDITKEEKKQKEKQRIELLDVTDKSDILILQDLDIEIKLYNIWNWQKRNEVFGEKHFGNQTAELIFNLLYYYTKQNDLVWDVFGGGGLTNDVCVKFNRECYTTDLLPKREFIYTCNVLETLPDIQPKFIFLDPPYWKQAEDEYSKNDKDFANMELDTFYNEFNSLFERVCEKYKTFTIAFLIANTQWKNKDKKVEPHGLKIYGIMKKYFEFEHHIIVPYSTQQYNGMQVNIAKENKLILNLHRDLLVFKK